MKVRKQPIKSGKHDLAEFDRKKIEDMAMNCKPRDPKRIPQILEELKTLWEKCPDQRLGQLLENYVFLNGERGDKPSIRLFYQEDDTTLHN